MGLTYFKRFRMEYDLNEGVPESKSVPFGYELVPFSTDLIRDHATAKFHSFRCELDANVFPCLGRRDGCLRLMREITSRSAFVPHATWLCRYRDSDSGTMQQIGTIQLASRRSERQNLALTRPSELGIGIGFAPKCRARVSRGWPAKDAS